MKATLIIALVLGFLVIQSFCEEEEVEMDLYEEEVELTSRTSCDKKCNNQCYDSSRKTCYPSGCKGGKDALCNKGWLPCWYSSSSYSCYNPSSQYCCYDPWWDASNGPTEYTICPIRSGKAWSCCHHGNNHKLTCYDSSKSQCCHDEEDHSSIKSSSSSCSGSPGNCPWWND